MFQERTEPATPRRRRKAREEGQVARSPDLVASVILLGVLWAMPGLLPRLAEQVTEFCVQTLAVAGQGGLGAASLGGLARRSLMQVGRVAGPVLGVIAAFALTSNVLQVGLHFTPKQLQPRFSRLDPLQGMKRLCNARSAVELLKGIAKVAAVGGTGWYFCSGRREELLRLAVSPPERIAPRIGELAHGMALRMVAALVVLAALDYAYQRRQHERSLRMTKQEVRDEYREMEGNPEIKSRIRQRQRETARRRMIAEVPRASVVITNPTHYAVALKYEMGTPGAPKVVAKGQDLIAQRIREVAEESGVPLMEDPPLARSLYRLVDLGQEIPPELYRAVAEVLAMVWRLDVRRREA
jgi:flagellar biosynthetic protein FlhB